MKFCNEIKRLIDEADQPDVVSFEVSNHLSACADCNDFARARVALRGLLLSGKRVSVPNNFDAVLNARIAEAKAARAFSWFGSPSFMKLGVAAAAVTVMVFVAQYGNLFSSGDQATPQENTVASAQGAPSPEAQKPRVLIPQERDVNNLAGVVPQRTVRGAGMPVRIAQTQRDYQHRGGRMPSVTIATDDYSSLTDRGVVLVRGPNGEREVPMPTVSVGAQPLLYVNAGRQSQPARSAATSF